MSRCLSWVNVRSTSTDSSSKSHGTRYEWLPCSRLCEDSSPNAIHRLNTAGSGRPSKPPMSWLQKPNPDAASDSPPRSDLGHRLERGRVVPAPVHRELLAADGRRPGVEHRLAFAAVLAQRLEDRLVVQLGVVVVHPLGVAAVVVHDVDRDPLAEVGLEAVDAHLHEGAQLARVPGPRVRVGEVDEAPSRPATGPTGRRRRPAGARSSRRPRPRRRSGHAARRTG